MNEQPEKTLAEDLAEEAASDFQRTVADASPEHLAQISKIVNDEAKRRDDPFKRLGEMSDHELEELRDRTYK